MCLAWGIDMYDAERAWECWKVGSTSRGSHWFSLSPVPARNPRHHLINVIITYTRFPSAWSPSTTTHESWHGRKWNQLNERPRMVVGQQWRRCTCRYSRCQCQVCRLHDGLRWWRPCQVKASNFESNHIAKPSRVTVHSSRPGWSAINTEFGGAR